LSRQQSQGGLVHLVNGCRWVQQAGPGELPRAMIGPNLRAAGLFLQYDIGLTTRKVVRALATI
jgi:hypothetical protein